MVHVKRIGKGFEAVVRSPVPLRVAELEPVLLEFVLVVNEQSRAALEKTLFFVNKIIVCSSVVSLLHGRVAV